MDIWILGLAIVALATGINGQCSPTSPCLNGGGCIASACSCPRCYYGSICQYMYTGGPACPCLNGGVCGCYYNGINRIFRCTCPTGWAGLRCESPAVVTTVGPCSPNPCQNGGACAVVGYGFACTCATGWTGYTCTTAVTNACSTGPCLNGGVCTPTATSYYCTCPTGWTGYNCQTPTGGGTTCAAYTCMNGGTCLQQATGYTCECPCFVVGIHCEHTPYALNLINNCQSSPCQNGGVCKCVGFGYKCQCNTPYTGTHCETGGSTGSTGCDHVILIDLSAGMATTQYKNHANNLITAIDGIGGAGSGQINPTKHRVGILFFNSLGSGKVYLNFLMSAVSLISIVNSSPTVLGTSTLAQALIDTRDVMLAPANGERPDDTSNPDIVYILSDGSGANAAAMAAATSLKATGATVISLVLGTSANWAMMSAIASPLSSFFVNVYPYSWAPVMAKGCQITTSTSPCIPSPCVHGVCVSYGTAFYCFCSVGWSGTKCDQSTASTDCVTYPCQNGGTCMNPYTATMRCDCPCYVMGTYCEIPPTIIPTFSPCMSSPCPFGQYCRCIRDGWKCY